jgi:hypothetical protein
VLYEPAGAVPAVPDGATIDDAAASFAALFDVVCDFPFESPDHRAACLAGLLTPLARFAFDGPAPLFLIDANVRGAGKGLLAQTIGQVVLGREMPVSSYAHDPEEMRKKVTAIALAGDRVVHLDNLEGSFGNDVLDRALTATRWKDRILGKSQEVDVPLIPVWYGTRNNVAVAADTARRVTHVRLDVLAERPEERAGFRPPDLLGHLRRERGRLPATRTPWPTRRGRRGGRRRSRGRGGSTLVLADVTAVSCPPTGPPRVAAHGVRVARVAARLMPVCSTLVPRLRGASR